MDGRETEDLTSTLYGRGAIIYSGLTLLQGYRVRKQSKLWHIKIIIYTHLNLVASTFSTTDVVYLPQISSAYKIGPKLDK